MDKKLQISLLLDFYGSMLSEKQKEIMDYYYNDDLSLSEVADNIGITRQGVHDVIKRTEAAVFDMEEKLGLYQQFDTVRAGLSEIELMAHQIERLNAKNGNHEDINRIVKDMLLAISKLNQI